MSHLIVVGGGAAGMMAAIIAARNGNEVSLYEKNEKLEYFIRPCLLSTS